jgi:uncharacterized membrane protein
MTGLKRGGLALLVLLLCLLFGVAYIQGTDHHLPVSLRIEDLIKGLTLYLARFVEFAGALVIGIASVRSLGSYFLNLAHGTAMEVPKEEIRLALGRSLALALEFELGADILKTAVAPTWHDIGLLAAIAVLRTALNYFLERELRNAEARHPGMAEATGSAPARGA